MKYRYLDWTLESSAQSPGDNAIGILTLNRPDHANAIKLEMFVFDALPMAKNPLILATLAMCTHGVITLADAEAMKEVTPEAYMFVQYIFLTPGMALVFLSTRPPEQSVYQHLFSGWARTSQRFIIAGVTAYASYYFILWAFQLGANVAAVSAVRQISIPASVLMGCLIFKEERMTARLAWSLILALGVVVIVFSN